MKVKIFTGDCMVVERECNKWLESLPNITIGKVTQSSSPSSTSVIYLTIFYHN